MIIYILYVIGYFISFMLVKFSLKEVAQTWGIIEKVTAYIISLLSWVLILWVIVLMIYDRIKKWGQ